MNLTSGFRDNRDKMSTSNSSARSYLIPKMLVVVARMKTVRRALKQLTFKALVGCLSMLVFNANTLSSKDSLYHLSWRRWSAPSEKVIVLLLLSHTKMEQISYGYTVVSSNKLPV